MPVAFVVYLLSAVAMAFWGPFDQPVGRDIAGGAAAELSGVDRVLFLGGRWLLLVVAAAVGGAAVPRRRPRAVAAGLGLDRCSRPPAVLAVLVWAAAPDSDRCAWSATWSWPGWC